MLKLEIIIYLYTISITMVKQFKRSMKNQEPESEEEEEEEYGDEVTTEEQERIIINDIETIEKKIMNIKSDYFKFFKGKNPNWLETPEITCEQTINQDMDVDDDIKRELSFYNISFLNAVNGMNHLKRVILLLILLLLAKRAFE